MYAELPYTDLSAWRAWIDHPLQIQQGQGGLRLWLRFADKQLAEATADVALGNINARLAPELPVLEMRSLQGRWSAKRAQGGYDIGGKRVAMTLQSGVTLPPAQFALKWRPGDDARAESGEVRIDALELQPLALLGEYLPLPPQLRKFLADAAPQGKVSDMQVDWQGSLPNPQRFSARGRFDQLGMRAHARLPGFSGLSGNIDANEKGGSALLDSAKAGAGAALGIHRSVARIRHAKRAVGVDPCGGRVAAQAVEHRLCQRRPGRDSLRQLCYRIRGSGRDRSHRAAEPYRRPPGAALYSFLNKVVRDWLERALLAGRASEVSMRLKGNLRDFPFQSKNSGVFQISAKVAGGSLSYAEGWPTIEGIDAELHFNGRSMEVVSRKASVLGARVTKARVSLPDLFAQDRILAVNGQAEGPTAEFLKFVAQSPVNGLTGGITANMGATGSGKLQLNLELPLARLADVKLAGSYQIAGNQISIDPDWPPLSQAGGRLEFTETGVSTRALNAQFLGGPVAVKLASQRDGSVAVEAKGTLNASALQAALEQPLLRRLSGATDWSANLNFRRSGASILVESGLQGIVSTLPAPLNKAAAAVLPLRFEHSVSTEEQSSRWSGPPASDRSTLALGKILRVEQHRRREGGKMLIQRGAIGLNEAPRLPEAGIVLNGTASALDLDQWMSVLGGADAAPVPLRSLSLKIGVLDVYGKRINDVAVRAGFQGSDWLADIDARESRARCAGAPRAKGTGKRAAVAFHLS